MAGLALRCYRKRSDLLAGGWYIPLLLGLAWACGEAEATNDPVAWVVPAVAGASSGTEAYPIVYGEWVVRLTQPTDQPRLLIEARHLDDGRLVWRSETALEQALYYNLSSHRAGDVLFVPLPQRTVRVELATGEVTEIPGDYPGNHVFGDAEGAYRLARASSAGEEVIALVRYAATPAGRVDTLYRFLSSHSAKAVYRFPVAVAENTVVVARLERTSEARTQTRLYWLKTSPDQRQVGEFGITRPPKPCPHGPGQRDPKPPIALAMSDLASLAPNRAGSGLMIRQFRTRPLATVLDSSHIDGALTKPPLVDGGREQLLLVHQNRVSAYSLLTRRLRWQLRLPTDMLTSRPALHDGVLYFPGENGYLYRIDANEGEILDRRPIPKTAGRLHFLAESFVFVGGSDGKLYRYGTASPHPLATIEPAELGSDRPYFSRAGGVAPTHGLVFVTDGSACYALRMRY